VEIRQRGQPGGLNLNQPRGFDITPGTPLEGGIRHDIKISDPTKSIPVARIPKFPLVDSVRVILALELFVVITWQK